MLTAHRQNAETKIKSLAQDDRNTRSFDRVVNSIDGLRERVQGFSVEQLSDVDKNLGAMFLRLAELQKTLSAITQIKNTVEDLDIKLKRAEAASLEQSSLAELDKPGPIHSITQVVSLRKFQQIIKLVNGASDVPLGLASGDSRSQPASIPSPPIDVTSETPLEAEETEQLLDRFASIKDLSREGMDEDEPRVAETDVENGFDLQLQPDAPKTVHPELADAEIEHASVRPPNIQEPPIQSKATNNELTAESGAHDTHKTEIEIFSEFHPVFHTTPKQLDPGPNQTFPKDPDNTIFSYSGTTSSDTSEVSAEFPDTSDRPGKNHGTSRDENIEPGTNIPPPPDVNFDQQLLDDLIKNYGEFNVQQNSAAENEQETIEKNSTSTLQANSIPPFAQGTQRNLPVSKKDGELDLKLKKLIKDYGEYDLYSRQSPLNLKTGVVAIVLILALVFSGFYFFSSRTSVIPSDDPAASQKQISQQPIPEPIPDKIRSRGNVKLQDAAPTSSISNPDLQVIFEAERSSDLSNKITPKQTK